MTVSDQRRATLRPLSIGTFAFYPKPLVSDIGEIHRIDTTTAPERGCIARGVLLNYDEAQK